MARKKKPLPTLEALHITDFAAEGKAIARVALNPDKPEEKMVVFVPWAAPGDVADVRLLRKKHSFAEGQIERLVEPSSVRVEPRCSHFTVCGGCKWQHLPYSEQLKYKHKQVCDTLQRIAKVDLPEVKPILGSENEWYYRNKMEYTFSNKKWRTWEQIRSGEEFEDSNNGLGFHIPGAFDKVLHLRECHLQNPQGDRIRNFIYDFAEEHGLSFYDIRNNKGLLRTLMIRLVSTGEQMVVLSFGEDNPGDIALIMNAIQKEFPEITSLMYVVNTKANDTISDLDIKTWHGKDHVMERMEDLQFKVGPKSFYQTNSAQAYQLYSQVRRMAGLDKTVNLPIAERSLVYDLYTGTGTIACFVAKGAKHVVGVEYVPEAIEDAKVNSEINGLTHTTFVAGDMKDVLTPEFVEANGRPDIIIVDPPRAGMHPDVVNVILNTAPRKIVYVSCNPATQARDLALLDVGYKVTEVQPVDMFPHTHHVENIVLLERRD
ncbi:MAG: 23S rRNA (uracil(1939)-C(5))-methyltransferase RlmD [Prevotella sp.]|nr:23S rRNA (uracil(1939)-C(5))-methyltransferase RlmD [Prevotella sp.]MCM1074297.1 23S rRNA (uracil(1939)-C(5))-methyltransferase RlmD [Ruminococcus sp.]